MPFYAVVNGRVPGIYETWEECKKQTDKFLRPVFKKFETESQAKQYIESHPPVFSSAQTSSSSSRKKAPKSQCQQKLGSCISMKGTAADCNGPIVYTDGACDDNGKWAAKGGIGVFWGHGHPDNVSEPLEGRQTNNIAEIRAAVRAIEQAKRNGHKELTIRTDSNFLIQSATEWINGWQRRNWKLAGDGGPVKNKDDFLALIYACDGMDKIVWEKVRGHSGDQGNDQADRLARAGAKRLADSTNLNANKRARVVGAPTPLGNNSRPLPAPKHYGSRKRNLR